LNLIKNILKIYFKDQEFEHHVNLLNKNTHPNIRFIEKLIDQKTNKIKQNILIEQIRSLNKFINESSSVKNLSKFIVIDSADDLNINSANSFLKTLEEPKKNTYIFLISHHLSLLMPTIRSRCMKIRLDKHNYDNFKIILKNKINNISEDELKFYYNLTLGSPGNTISYYDYDIINILENILKILPNNNIDHKSRNLIENLSNLDDDKFKSFLLILKTILITLNKMKLGIIDKNSSLVNDYSELKNLSNLLT